MRQPSNNVPTALGVGGRGHGLWASSRHLFRCRWYPQWSGLLMSAGRVSVASASVLIRMVIVSRSNREVG